LSSVSVLAAFSFPFASRIRFKTVLTTFNKGSKGLSCRKNGLV